MCLMAWAVVACGDDKGTASQPISSPDTTVMRLQTEPTWSHQIIIESGVPVVTERAPSHQILK